MNPIKSKYEQVQRHLRDLIQGRKLLVGQKLPSELSLCRQLGVGRVTVRRAITNLVKQGLVESRPGYGHVVRATTDSPVIGLLINYPLLGRGRGHRILPAFGLMTMNLLRAQLEQHGCQVRLYLPKAHETDHVMDHAALLDDLQRERIAGLITASWPHPASRNSSQTLAADIQVLEQIERQRLPLVSVTRREVPQASTSTDYLAIGSMGAQYFLERGIHRIALMTLSDQPNNPTIDGFQQALADFGGRVHEPWIVGVDAHDERHGFETFSAWWPQLEHHPDALVIEDDQTGKGAMLAAAMMGLHGDEHLRVACQTLRGVDVFTVRPFVRLEIDPADHARDAVEKMLSLLRNPHAQPPRTWIRPRIIEPMEQPTPSSLPQAATSPCPADREHPTPSSATSRGDYEHDLPRAEKNPHQP